MSVIFPLLLVAILLACAASVYREGMWGNALNLVNVILAGLIAFNFFEPLAKWLEDIMPSFTLFHDFVALWLIFCLSLLVLRMATTYVSRTKVRFLAVADRIGSGAFALLVGWVMVCFTTASLHTAPLARKFLWGGFNPEKRMMFGLAPDRQWLGLVRMVSAAGLGRGEEHRFDPNGAFIVKYAAFRSAVEEVAGSGSLMTRSGSPIPARAGGRAASSEEREKAAEQEG
ncbi:MAG TPA: CvpA family protein [Planctomycetaceae bacterium]|nr:CvpA family protein [Planctomycetaceae bacterium]HIQ20168.1 CvpA family protein [Planctomycetota bacterium]